MQMTYLSYNQIEEVFNWLNQWEQLKDTAIPIRFKEDFTKAFEKQKKHIGFTMGSPLAGYRLNVVRTPYAKEGEAILLVNPKDYNEV